MTAANEILAFLALLVFIPSLVAAIGIALLAAWMLVVWISSGESEQ